jgi:uncharacterized protein YdeI (YjbR/CyaY-like superfamily)
MAAFDDFQEFTPRSRADWRRWLERNHARKPGVWLIYWKKGTGKQKVSYADAVEEALCFGWIDSKVQPIDSERYRQIFTPRKPGSVWSKLNKARVEKLLKAGSVADAGLRVIEQAKSSGAWTVLDQVEALLPPEELERALETDPVARVNFEAYSVTWRKILIRHITSVKSVEIRARRAADVARIAALGLPPRTLFVKKSG